MTASNTNVIQVIKAGTELGADQWVCRGLKLASNAVGLEAENTCCDKVDVIAPSGNNWVALNASARNSCGSETCLESYTIN